MSALKVLAAAVAVTGFMVTQSLALTISNRDASSRMVFISKSTAPSDLEAQSYEEQLTVSGRKSVTHPCTQSCSARLAGSDSSVTLDNNSNLVISQGKLKKQ